MFIACSACSPFARSLRGVAPERVAVWGTSFAGGHALVTAATVPGVAAAVCQCPMMDGLAAVLGIVKYAGPGQLLRLTAHGLWDAVLAPFADSVSERFNEWLMDKAKAGVKFSADQLAWLNLIRDHIATSLSIEPDDFDYAPFSQRGGLGKAHQLFGEQLPKLLDELIQKKPDSAGKPAMASVPIKKTACVQGILLFSPPILRMSCSPESA